MTMPERKRRVAELVGRGCTREEAARVVGVSRRTAYEYLKDPAVAAHRVPRDLELPEGTLLPMIDELHLARAGTTFEWPTTDLERPKGKEWPEDELDRRFPALVAHYEG